MGQNPAKLTGNEGKLGKLTVNKEEPGKSTGNEGKPIKSAGDGENPNKLTGNESKPCKSTGNEAKPGFATGNEAKPCKSTGNEAKTLCTLQKAIDMVTKATEQDKNGNYLEALLMYKHGVDYFLHSIKFEAHAEEVKESIQAKCAQYLDRAEELQTYVNKMAKYAKKHVKDNESSKKYDGDSESSDEDLFDQKKFQRQLSDESQIKRRETSDIINRIMNIKDNRMTVDDALRILHNSCSKSTGNEANPCKYTLDEAFSIMNTHLSANVENPSKMAENEENPGISTGNDATPTILTVNEKRSDISNPFMNIEDRITVNAALLALYTSWYASTENKSNPCKSAVFDDALRTLTTHVRPNSASILQTAIDFVTMAKEHDKMGNDVEAIRIYKYGVEYFLQSIKFEVPGEKMKESIRAKCGQYLERVDKLQQRHNKKGSGKKPVKDSKT